MPLCVRDVADHNLTSSLHPGGTKTGWGPYRHPYLLVSPPPPVANSDVAWRSVSSRLVRVLSSTSPPGDHPSRIDACRGPGCARWQPRRPEFLGDGRLSTLERLRDHGSRAVCRGRRCLWSRTTRGVYPGGALHSTALDPVWFLGCACVRMSLKSDKYYLWIYFSLGRCIVRFLSITRIVFPAPPTLNP